MAEMNFYGETLPVFRATLHTHTKISDGAFPPDYVVGFYRAEGYDVLAFSDHRKTNPVSTYESGGMTLLSGIELHPTGPRGIPWHLLALGVPEDFPGEYPDAQSAIDAVTATGGVVFAAHPHWCGLTSADILRLHGRLRRIRGHFPIFRKFLHLVRYLLPPWHWLAARSPERFSTATPHR